ncbi:MAG: N-acetylmuramoyl-L-alanine amidase [Rhodovulum sulfidophilum]|uniref:N-acetylmuramoyl-L-alanine amidase n=1 Tax=Rhodovulum sulfidophilum TaxID=35806 RepID=A0A2W5N8Q9_RHOSU|nr:MAG: N-acetylmuramoyl-L-alanine amidase [Rhodovulum sulfidophilum]
MESAEAALDRLCDPAAEVSAHYVIGERGAVWALVPEEARAWHAGAGAWGAARDVNSRSIGIELVNAGALDGLPPFPEPQMAALEALLDGIMARWAIPPARVIGHSDMAPGRKGDPGPKFDWRRLARGGRAIFAGAAGLPAAAPDWDRFAAHAGTMGYHAPEAGGWPAVLGAFRLRFRPGATGPLSGADVALAAALAGRHPCVDAAALPT